MADHGAFADNQANSQVTEHDHGAVWHGYSPLDLLEYGVREKQSCRCKGSRNRFSDDRQRLEQQNMRAEEKRQAK
jgi:hypothetical protein